MSFCNLKGDASPNGNAGETGISPPSAETDCPHADAPGRVLLLGAGTGLAKDKTPTTRTVSGVVMDEAENPIQGAMIELTDLQTKKVLDIYSQEGGQYQFTDLRFDHDYTVKATYKG